MKTPEQIAEEIWREWALNHFDLKEPLTTAIAAAIQAERDRAELAEQRLNNLLCRIHRDGGHYLHAHGIAKACVDADERVAWLNVLCDDYVAKDQVAPPPTNHIK